MKTWTVDQMLAQKPCSPYDRARITALLAGRGTITTRDFLTLDIPAEHRIWAALQDDTIAARVVERIVTRAVTTHALTCGVPDVETWAVRWLSGENRTEAAARAAERAAVEAVAWAAEAAGVAERAAAWAAMAAARAAGAAARAASWAAWAALAALAAEAVAWVAWAAEAAAGAVAEWGAAASWAAWAAERAAERDHQFADIRAVLDEDETHA
jgi:hypothetical protein